VPTISTWQGRRSAELEWLIWRSVVRLAWLIQRNRYRACRAGAGLKLSGPEMFRIAVTAAMLVAVVVLAKPCAHAVSGFVTSFDQGSGKGSAMVKPGTIDVAPATRAITTFTSSRA